VYGSRCSSVFYVYIVFALIYLFLFSDAGRAVGSDVRMSVFSDNNICAIQIDSTNIPVSILCHCWCS